MSTVFPVKLLSHLRPLLIGFRKSKGLTQRELSARLGVTQQTYARFEANPSSASIARLYKVFNIKGKLPAKFELSLPIDKNPPLLTLIIIFHRLMSMIHSAYPTVSHYQSY